MAEKRKKKRRRKFSPRKALRLLLIIAAIVMCCMWMCRRDDKQPATQDDTEVAATDPVGYDDEVEYVDLDSPLDFTPSQDRDEDKMPEPTVKMRVNYFGDLAKAFNDSNYVHYAEASKYGIEPLHDLRSHWQMRRPLKKVTSCSDYFVERLTYSRPYLVPEAEATLREIGRRFRDTIQARGGGDYRIKVTSLLRTPATVKLLKRRNRNAVDSSVHQCATTFDISYARFIAGSDSIPRSVDDLKGVLAEVLRAMRNEGKIWVKYERKQPCFHITARKPSDE